MKLGASSYCLSRGTRSGEMTILDVISWMKENGAEHMEISPSGYDLIETPALIDEIRNKASEEGIRLSNYAIGANFLQPDEESYRAEIERVKKHVDVAAKLGVPRMRHDVASRPLDDDLSLSQFERDLPAIVKACREITEYAEDKGVVTMVENHGFYVQSSERIYRLVKEVNHKNYKTLLDVGNFLCADEDPLLAVKRNLEIAEIIHLKDFYRRSSAPAPGEGWFSTVGGYALRGSILGHGDIDLPAVMKVIKESGYDGDISLEFEGMEDYKLGTRLGLQYGRSLWDSI